MKRFLLLTTAVSVISLAQGQEVKEIRIDAQNKTIDRTGIKNMKYGDAYRVVITGINQNLYKVSLTAADSILSKPQQTPAFGGGFDVDAISKLVSGIGQFSTVITASGNFEKANNLMAMLYEDKLQNKMFVAGTLKGDIKKRMDRERDSLNAAVKHLKDLAWQTDSLKLEVAKVRLFAVDATGRQTHVVKLDDALSIIQEWRNKIKAWQKSTESAQEEYDKFYKANRAEIEKDEDLKRSGELISGTYESLSKTLTDAEGSINADKTYELLSQIVLINNNSEATYRSFPIQYLGEQAVVNVSLAPREEKYNLQSYSIPITFPEVVLPYTVVGVSFYSASLHDEVYTTVKNKITDSTYSYSYKKEEGNNSELGIAALLRYGKKSEQNSLWGGHFSFGGGISVSNKIKPRILIGGGVSYGRKHMIAVDAGGIFGYVDRLSNAVNRDHKFEEKPETVTVSKLRGGAFLSIGYIFQF